MGMGGLCTGDWFCVLLDARPPAISETLDWGVSELLFSFVPESFICLKAFKLSRPGVPALPSLLLLGIKGGSPLFGLLLLGIRGDPPLFGLLRLEGGAGGPLLPEGLLALEGGGGGNLPSS